MRKARLLVGVLGLIALSMVVSGCLNLFAPKVGQLKGTVSYESGTPIADAEVKLGTAVAKTNAQGSYAFLNMKHGTYDFAVIVGGATVYTQKVTIGNTPATVHVKVPDPVQYGTIAGTVKREDDTPIADVTVKLDDRTTTTDAAGAFEFEDVPYGTYTVKAEVDGEEYSAAANLNAAQIDVTIVVPDVIVQGDVSGSVKDDADRPVEGAVVSLGGENTTTNAAGEFEFPGVLFGAYTLTVSVWDEEVYTENVDVDDETVELDIAIEVALVTGSVTDQDDNPIGDAVVKMGPLGLSTTTEADGSYIFTNVPYTNYTFTVEVDGDELHTHNLVVDQPDVVYDAQVNLPVAGPQLVYEEDFSGPGATAEDFDFTLHNNGTWTIVEDEGKRWIKGDHTSWAVAYVDIPELADADRITVEYTLKPLRSNVGVNLLADQTSANGGTNYFSFHITWGHSMRFMKANTQTKNRDTADLKAVLDVPMDVRITIDRVAATIDMEVDGTRVGDYPWALTPEDMISGPDNTWIRLYVNNSAGQWTDLKVWVE